MNLPEPSWITWTLYGIGWFWLFSDAKHQAVKQRDWNGISAAVVTLVCFVWPLVVPAMIAFRSRKL